MQFWILCWDPSVAAMECGSQRACCREPTWLIAPPADYQSPPPCLCWGCTSTCPFLCIERILVLSLEPLAWGLPISLVKIFFDCTGVWLWTIHLPLPSFLTIVRSVCSQWTLLAYSCSPIIYLLSILFIVLSHGSVCAAEQLN